MDEERDGFLFDTAKRYIWWKPPEESLLCRRRVLAQVMNIGTWDDLCRLVEFFSEEELADVLRSAEPGEFAPRSWSFWHCRLSGDIPPMPGRAFGE